MLSTARRPHPSGDVTWKVPAPERVSRKPTDAKNDDYILEKHGDSKVAFWRTKSPYQIGTPAIATGLGENLRASWSESAGRPMIFVRKLSSPGLVPPQQRIVLLFCVTEHC
jgi:hypothetical protein